MATESTSRYADHLEFLRAAQDECLRFYNNLSLLSDENYKEMNNLPRDRQHTDERFNKFGQWWEARKVTNRVFEEKLEIWRHICDVEKGSPTDCQGDENPESRCWMKGMEKIYEDRARWGSSVSPRFDSFLDSYLEMQYFCRYGIIPIRVEIVNVPAEPEPALGTEQAEEQVGEEEGEPELELEQESDGSSDEYPDTVASFTPSEDSSASEYSDN
ncbi:hypothetical protein ABW19_dt0205863 [Dactylella cylindrospora]|nr:hypothetical protein ABW19_dt0205863 [Dactylella cylindrospora]